MRYLTIIFWTGLISVALFLGMLLMAAIFGLASAVFLWPVTWILDQVGIQLQGLSMFLVLALMFGVGKLPKGWIPRIKSVSDFTRIKINAPLTTVWDAVRPRPRDDYYLPGTAKITEEGDDVFHQHFEAVSDESPDQPAQKPVVLTVSDVVPMSSFQMTETSQAFRIGATPDGSLYQLSEQDGVTTLDLLERFKNVSVLFWLFLKLANPGKRALKSLKFYCEGKPDTTFLARQVRFTRRKRASGQMVTVEEVLIMATFSIMMGVMLLGSLDLALAYSRSLEVASIMAASTLV